MIDAELTVDSLHATGESLVWHVAEQALFVLVLVTYVPAISLWLPRAIGV